MELIYKRQPLTGGEGAGIPSGVIVAYSGTSETIPEGWAVCDGENGTPDLRGRFILGVSEKHPLAEVGGEENVTLTVGQMPAHEHSLNAQVVTDFSSAMKDLQSGKDRGTLSKQFVKATATGGGQPHNNMPPFYALIYIMKL